MFFFNYVINLKYVPELFSLINKYISYFEFFIKYLVYYCFWKTLLMTSVMLFLYQKTALLIYLRFYFMKLKKLNMYFYIYILIL